MNDLVQIYQFMLNAVTYAAPYFLISIFLGVMVRALKLEGSIKRVFDNNIMVAIVLATAVGAFSPFCSCTVVPIIAGLLVGGVPLAPIMAFWLASPTMDPEIFALSVGILGWPIAVARLIATLLLSLGAGYLTLLVTQTSWLKNIQLIKNQPEQAGETAVSCCAPQSVQDSVPVPAFPNTPGAINLQMVTPSQAIPLDVPVVETSCGDNSCAMPPVESHRPILEQIRHSLINIDRTQVAREFAKDGWLIGKWLLVAFLMEALITLYVPQTAVSSFLGNQNGFAVPFAALIGVPLYLTNITAPPIVSGLLTQGMQTGAAIAFLIAGPVTTMPAMTAVYGIVHHRIFVLYLLLGLGGAVLLGLLTNLFF